MSVRLPAQDKGNDFFFFFFFVPSRKMKHLFPNASGSRLPPRLPLFHFDCKAFMDEPSDLKEGIPLSSQSRNTTLKLIGAQKRSHETKTRLSALVVVVGYFFFFSNTFSGNVNWPIIIFGMRLQKNN